MKRRHAAALAVALLCAGCMAVPLPEHGHLGGHLEIPEELRDDLVEGETTREDVLLDYGIPEYRVDGDRVLAYRWTTSHGYWVVFLYYVGNAGAIRKRNMLLLEFDTSGRLARHELVETSPGRSAPYRTLRRVARVDEDAPAEEEPADVEVRVERLTDLDLAAAWAAGGLQDPAPEMEGEER